MCVYVGPEVLLANLLSHKPSVSSRDIELYCENLKKAFSNKTNIINLYLDSNDKSLKYALSRYKEEFRQFQGRFYKNKAINIHHFNDRFDKNISSILNETARALK